MENIKHWMLGIWMHHCVWNKRLRRFSCWVLASKKLLKYGTPKLSTRAAPSNLYLLRPFWRKPCSCRRSARRNGSRTPRPNRSGTSSVEGRRTPWGTCVLCQPQTCSQTYETRLIWTMNTYRTIVYQKNKALTFCWWLTCDCWSLSDILHIFFFWNPVLMFPSLDIPLNIHRSDISITLCGFIMLWT